VATVDGVPVTAVDLRRRFWEGSMEERYRALDRGGRLYLTNLAVEDVLLHEEAKRRGLGPRFQDIRPYHEGLMKRLLAKELDVNVRRADVTREDIQEEYARLRPDLVEPDRRSVQIHAATTREAAEGMIEAIARARLAKNAGELNRLFLEHEAENSRSAEGDLSFEQAATSFGEAVAQIAFEVDPDDLGYHPEPVPFGDGWAVIVVLTELQPPPVPSLEEIEDQLRERAYGRRRDAALDELVATFRARHSVVLHPETMELVPWVVEDVAPPPADIASHGTVPPPPPPPAAAGAPPGAAGGEPPVQDAGADAAAGAAETAAADAAAE
jgi:hypothetical protein